MRHWLLHPLIFYPLVIVIAVLLIAVSLKPQAWPRPASPVSGAEVEGALVLEGEALGVPTRDDAAQAVFVERDLWGRAQSLRIAVKPSQPAPDAASPGVRILLSEAAAARLSGRIVAEVSYLPSPVNAASGLALSLEGAGPNVWVSQPLPAQPGSVRFELPAQATPTALGLRALTEGTDQAYGLEITRIRLIPHTGSASSN